MAISLGIYPIFRQTQVLIHSHVASKNGVLSEDHHGHQRTLPTGHALLQSSPAGSRGGGENGRERPGLNEKHEKHM